MAGKAIEVRSCAERKVEAVRIAKREQAIPVAPATAPDRADSVDHVAGGEPEAGRDLRLSGLAAVKLGAGCTQLQVRRRDG